MSAFCERVIFVSDVAMPSPCRQPRGHKQKGLRANGGLLAFSAVYSYADTALLKALKKPSMSWCEPMEMRDTVGQIGQRPPAISTSWARNAACISLADLVFQSIITKLVWLGPISLRLRLVRKSIVMARFDISSLRRLAISSWAVRLVVAQTSDGIGNWPDSVPPSYICIFLTRSGRAMK